MPTQPPAKHSTARILGNLVMLSLGAVSTAVVTVVAAALIVTAGFFFAMLILVVYVGTFFLLPLGFEWIIVLGSYTHDLALRITAGIVFGLVDVFVMGYGVGRIKWSLEWGFLAKVRRRLLGLDRPVRFPMEWIERPIDWLGKLFRG